MVRHGVWAAAFAAIGIGLAACGGAPPGAAVQTAQRLVEAAQADDRIAFEVEIDRQAVREDLRVQVAEMAKGNTLEVDGGPSEFALDRMIAPAAVRLLKIGGTDFAKVMTMKAGRACVPDAADGCLLTFAKGKAGWKLVGMRATDLNAMSGLNDPTAPPPEESEEP
jgi:pantoate kinase